MHISDLDEMENSFLMCCWNAIFPRPGIPSILDDSLSLFDKKSDSLFSANNISKME